jgi:peptidyl-prolyl cis-trans isomerase SurA
VKPATYLVTAVLCLVVLSGCGSGASVSEDIVARVNSKDITAAELEQLYQSRVATADPAPTPEEAQALKFQLLTQMINDEILLQMAASSSLSATDAEVDTKFTDLKSQYSEEQFQDMLKQQKLTADDVKTEMRKALTLEKLITKEITSRINVSDNEIRDVYEKNKASFNLPEGYRLQHILVTPFAEAQVTNAKRDDARSPADARTKAERLYRDIQGGQDFAIMARDWSEDSDSAPSGGDMGFRALADLEMVDPKLAQAVQRLKIGESSALIDTKYGYHILKLLEKDAGGQKDLSNAQVQAQIRQAIFGRKEEMLRAAFSETARNKAQISNYMAERLLESVGRAASAAPATTEDKTAEKPAEDKADAPKAEEKK